MGALPQCRSMLTWPSPVLRPRFKLTSVVLGAAKSEPPPPLPSETGAIPFNLPKNFAIIE